MCLTNVHIAPEEFFGAEHHIAQCTNQETHSILEPVSYTHLTLPTILRV